MAQKVLDLDAEEGEQPERKTPARLAPVKSQNTDVLTLSNDPEILLKQGAFLLGEKQAKNVHRLDPNMCRVALDVFLRRKNREVRLAKVPDPFKTLEGIMSEFPGLTKTNSAEIKKRLARWKPDAPLRDEGFDSRERPEDIEPEPIENKEVQTAPDGMEVNVYNVKGSTPVAESNPRRRDGPSVGEIKEIEPAITPITDLIGDRPPRNLTDLYHRWPIEGDDRYHIRVERTKPRTFQGVQVAGLVAEIRGRRVTEAEIQHVYGGAEYKLQLYGPDPRSRQSNQDGEFKIKALTEPFTLIVPVYPPNMMALPGTENNNMQQPSQPFGGMPKITNASDAAIHKVDTQHTQYMFEQQQAKELEAAKAQNNLFTIFDRQAAENLKHEREESRRREERSEKQLEAERIAREKQEQALKEAKDASGDTLLKLFEKLGPDRQGEIQRATDYYKGQLEVVRHSFEDQIKAMRDRHEGDLRRADERQKDGEHQYRLLLEQERMGHTKTVETERSSWANRERDLREHFDKQLIAAEKQHQQRVDDMKERHATELRGLEKMQLQMMNTIKESFDVKSNVSDQTHKMMLQNTLERLEDARGEAQRAREEADDAKDLGKQLERMEQQASLLGYEKKDADAPRGWAEKLAVTAGAGISQLMSNANEWLPAVMEKRQQQQLQMAQLQAQNPRPQMSPQQQAAVQQQQRAAAMRQQGGTDQGRANQVFRTRGAQWGSEGQAPPVSASMANEDLGFRESTPPTPPPAQKEAVQPKPAEESEVVNTEGHEAEEMPSMFPKKFVDAFTEEGVGILLVQVEKQIQLQVDPAGFANIYVPQFPEQAQLLFQQFKPEEVVEMIRGIKGAEKSPILRREGGKWLQALWKAIPKVLAAQTS